jgi:hypothetical protein
MVGIKTKFKFESNPFIKILKKSLYENDKFLTDLFGKIPGLSTVLGFASSLSTGMLNAINPLKGLFKIPDKKIISPKHKFGIELYGSIGFTVEIEKEADEENGKSTPEAIGEIGIEFKIEGSIGVPLLSLSSGIEASIKPKIFTKVEKNAPDKDDYLKIMFSGIRFEFAGKVTKNASVIYKKDNPKPEDSKDSATKKADKYQILKEREIMKFIINKDKQPAQAVQTP